MRRGRRQRRRTSRGGAADHESRGGRIVKTTGDGLLLEFPSVVAAVECAIAIQKVMAERNADMPEAKRIVFASASISATCWSKATNSRRRVNIAARLEGICEPGGILVSSAAYEHVRGRIERISSISARRT